MFTQVKLVVAILTFALHDQGFAEQIIGGKVVVPHSRPYMALLERMMPDNTMKYCGGFLLSEDFVMTAAHCKAQNYTVKLGLHEAYDENADVQIITVDQSFPNKDYKPAVYMNDVMLLKLRSKAKFTKNVAPIEIANHYKGGLPTSCTVSGWGRHDNSGMMSSVLREVNITLIFNEKCEKENSYCSEGETGPGEGDSGGPLVCENGEVYGVVSSKLSNTGGPPLYRFAKITDYRRWIASTTAKRKRKI